MMTKTMKMTVEISDELYGFAAWAAEQNGHASAEDYLKATLNAALLAAKNREKALYKGRDENLFVEDDGGGVWHEDDIKHGYGF
jgi:hypothetical protein